MKMTDDRDIDGRPSKRTKLSPGVSDGYQNTATSGRADSKDAPAKTKTDNISFADARELEVGITTYVSADILPFEAVLKTRYTDFLVNEILPSGEVVHLTNTSTSASPNPIPNVPPPTRVESAKKVYNAVSDIAKFSSSNGEQLAEQVALELEKPAEEVHSSKASEISVADKLLLIGFLNEDAVAEIMNLYQAIIKNPRKKPKEHPTVRTQFTDDRSVRAEIHEAIRRIFASRILTKTDGQGVLCLTAAPAPNAKSKHRQSGRDQPAPRQGKLGWMDCGGEYLHFTLFKENKDTMEVVSFLTRQMKLNAKNFQFAGTKDRRAVTAQRVSAFRVEVQRLAHQNRTLRNAAVGNFEYKPIGLELGDLSGNEFVLTLRECKFPTLTSSDTNHDLGLIEASLKKSLSNLHTNGFINYYGLQRFGTFDTRTDTTGLLILKGEFKSACDSILNYDPGLIAVADLEGETVPNALGIAQKPGHDDINRAKAIHLFQVQSNAHKALDILPRKFSAENQLIRHLARSQNDYFGALLSIPRNLRLMYVHAYQSFVWNHVASRRWELYGDNVVAGDLVLIKEHKDKQDHESSAVHNPTTDVDGEIIVEPQSDDRANLADDVFDRARPLSSAEAESGQYTIFDVVLPLPGHDILYPSNAVGEFYKTFMATNEAGNLDPHNMHRKQRDFSLTGGYRKLIATIGRDFGVDVARYARDDEQFVKTDLEKIKEKEKLRTDKNESTKENMNDRDVSMLDFVAETQDEVKNKIAAVLKFQLGASQYATMALRELSRGGIVAYKTEFGTAR